MISRENIEIRELMRELSEPRYRLERLVSWLAQEVGPTFTAKELLEKVEVFLEVEGK